MERLLARLATLTRTSPWLVVFALVASLAPTAWLASHLGLESSFTELLPRTYPSVRDLDAGIERTGGSAFAVVAIDARDRPRAEALADALARALPAEDYVRYVQARLDLEFVRDRALLYLSTDELERLVDEVATEIDRRTVDGAGLGLGLDAPGTATTSSSALDVDARLMREASARGLPSTPYTVGDDGRYLYVFVALRGDTGNLGWAGRTQAALEARTTALRDTIAPGLEVRYSGSLVIRLEDNGFLVSDLARASTLGFFGVVTLLVLYTRRLRTLLLLSVPLLVGITWTFAFAWLAVGRLNIISGFLASILSGLGIEFGIHLLLRYLEERSAGLGLEDAHDVALARTGRSLVGSALTNAAAFGVVSFAGFQGFSEFGVIAAVGMVLTLAATLVGFPALNRALERWRPMRVAPADAARAARGIHVPKPLRAAILVALPVFAAYSIVALAEGKVRFRTNWREIKGESPASDFDDYIIRSLGGSFTQSLILVDDLAAVPRVVEVLRTHRARRAERGLPQGITGHFSVADLVPADQPTKRPYLAELAKQLDRVRPERLDDAGRAQLARARTLTEAQPFDVDALPRSLVQRLLTRDGEGTLVTLKTDYLFYESSELVAWADELGELRAELSAAGLDAPIISENWIAGTVFQVIIGDGPFILLATILVVFVVVLLDFRDFVHALRVMGALLLGQLAIAGGMGLVGVELNFINAAVLPIVVGVSIDNAMHIYHRYLEEGPRSIPLVLRHTASATTLSSATNLMGFGAMIVAHHAGLRSVAELAMTGVALTFFSTSVWFPLALEWWGERFGAARG